LAFPFSKWSKGKNKAIQGGGFNPSEKYAQSSNGIIFPKVRGENKKYYAKQD